MGKSFKETKFYSLIEIVKNNYRCGKAWIGIDGLINMETSALLTIFFMIFFPKLLAMLLSFLVVITKCIVDRRNGHEEEMHDLICAIVGVLFGAILGLMIH